MKPNYLFIPIITLLVAFTGSQFTRLGLESGWYASLILPSFQPPAAVFGPVWTLLYALAAMSAIIIWNTSERSEKFTQVIVLFLINAALNVEWTLLFFAQHAIGAALIELVFLNVSTALLISLVWPHKVSHKFLWIFHREVTEQNSGVLKSASLLLVPYLLWTLFALVLNWRMWVLN